MLLFERMSGLDVLIAHSFEGRCVCSWFSSLYPSGGLALREPSGFRVLTFWFSGFWVSSNQSNVEAWKTWIPNPLHPKGPKP